MNQQNQARARLRGPWTSRWSNHSFPLSPGFLCKGPWGRCHLLWPTEKVFAHNWMHSCRGGRPPGDLERLRGRGSEDRRGHCPWGPPPAHWNRPYGSALWKVEREMGSSRPQRSPLPSLHRAGRLSPAPHVQAGQFEPQTTMAIKPVRLGIICYTAILTATSQLRMAAQLDY